MPFTPFHFGPGALAKVLLPRHFSLVAFLATQVVIDCETLYYMVRREFPLHRVAHSYVGATAVGIAMGLALFGVVVLRHRWTKPSGRISGTGRRDLMDT
jgi:hypothetical protein